jgi:uracil-DNA glycosylase family 4
VLFVAEAPGRLGADRTGVPLHGDRTGDNFEMLLSNIDWKREDVFITNAVLCNPRDEKGNNAPPSKREIANCAANLEMTINLVNPEVVVALGAVALTSLGFVSAHRATLRDDVAKAMPWNRRLLVPLYHPGPRAIIHRSLLSQRADYVLLAKLVDPLTGLKTTSAKKKRATVQPSLLPQQTPLEQIVASIVGMLGDLSYFKLTKLLYLVDLKAREQLGYLLSGSTYLRMQEGPWLPNLEKTVAALSGHEVSSYFRGKRPYVHIGPDPRFETELDEPEMAVIAEVIEKHGGKSDSELKTTVYLTQPMRDFIRREKAGEDTRRQAVLRP